jgi:hypothetical protein
MSRKSVVAGILLSLVVPIIMYFTIEVITYVSNAQGPSEDFQYRDSSFVMIHIDQVLYPFFAVITFTIYAVIVLVARYVFRKTL